MLFTAVQCVQFPLQLLNLPTIRPNIPATLRNGVVWLGHQQNWPEMQESGHTVMVDYVFVGNTNVIALGGTAEVAVQNQTNTEQRTGGARRSLRDGFSTIKDTSHDGRREGRKMAS